MPRPRTEKTNRSHHKKPAPAAPELEAMVDTIEDSINPDAPTPAASRPRQQKAGPKKVLSETTRIVGDGLAVGVMLATHQPDTRKNLTMEEAQSIGHPIIRMLGRRVPGWLKPLLPKTKLNPDDAADIEEIIATLGKWGVRLVTVMVQDFVEGREKAQAARQKEQVTHNSQHVERPSVAVPSASLSDLRAETREQAAALVTPMPNGHNPAFDVLNNIDLGVEA